MAGTDTTTPTTASGPSTEGPEAKPLWELSDEDLLTQTFQDKLLKIPPKSIASDETFTDEVFDTEHFQKDVQYYTAPTWEEERITIALLLKAYVSSATGSLSMAWLISRGILLLPDPADFTKPLFQQAFRSVVTPEPPAATGTSPQTGTSPSPPLPQVKVNQWMTDEVKTEYTANSTTLETILNSITAQNEDLVENVEAMAGEMDAIVSTNPTPGTDGTPLNEREVFVKWACETLKKETQSGLTDSYKYLKALLSYSHLILMRLVIKEVKSVSGAWDRQLVASHLTSMFKVDNRSGVTLFGPIRKYQNYVKVNINILHSDIRQIFLWSLKVYRESVISKNYKIRAREGILSAGFLLHTSMNGLGMIDYFLALAYKTNIDPNDLLSYFYVSPFQVSAARIVRFLLKTKDQCLWRWCRLIQNNYFSDMSVKSNLNFCVYLASALSLQEQNQGIWDSIALRDAKESLKTQAEDWATAFWECVTPSNDELEAKGEKAKLIKRKVGPTADRRMMKSGRTSNVPGGFC